MRENGEAFGDFHRAGAEFGFEHIRSLNILIKLMSMVAIVTASVNVAITLF